MNITIGSVTHVHGGTPDLDAYVSVDISVDGTRYAVGCCVGTPDYLHGSAIASGQYASYSMTAWYVDAYDWQSVGPDLSLPVLDALDDASERLYAEAQAMGLPTQEED